MKLLEIIEKKKIFENINKTKTKKNIKILGNVVLNHLIPYIEYQLNVCNHNVNCQYENYDNIIQDTFNLDKQDEIVIIFWELINIIETSIKKKINIDVIDLKKIQKNIEDQLKLVFSNVNQNTLVILNYFNLDYLNIGKNIPDEYKILCSNLNNFLNLNAPNNFKLIDTSIILKKNNISKCVNLDLYKKTKILYTQLFYYNYSLQINPIILSKLGNFKKVLVLDCDNTLWKGIIGEDKEDEILYSNKNEIGKIFFEIQTFIKELEKKGVLLCICSKNNYSDVIKFFSKDDMMLDKKDFAVLKINWKSKTENLQEISEILNLSLDSFVFVDDSDFEIDYVNKFLPEVLTLKVPKDLFDYKKKFKDLNFYFDLEKTTSEDQSRKKYYLDEKQRSQTRSNFKNVDDYLESLKIELKIKIDKVDEIDRVHQLINKTNQFNFTTIRYSKNEVHNIYNSKKNSLISVKVKDKFGDSGITGIIILKYNNEKVYIDTFLLSCRIIGRNIEYVLFDYIVKNIINKKYFFLEAKYIYSDKNSQIKNFYEKVGMKILEDNSKFRFYTLDLNKYKYSNIGYIKINE